MLAKEHIEIYSQICYLTNAETKCWKKLLNYGASIDLNVKRTFLWVWPEKDDLEKLHSILKEMKIDCLLSIGCGNGLLEWLFTESIGIAVHGLEIDRNWWQSAYSVQSFIPLNYVEDINEDNSLQFLQRCCNKKNWNFALLFCYFNNRQAFLNYLQMYKGMCIIIIGPTYEADIHTDPSPLEPHFPPNSKWILSKQLRLGATDIIAFYENL